MVLTFVWIHTFADIEKIPLRQKFNSFPKKIGKWEAINDVPFGDEILDILRVTDYLHRDYIADEKQIINFYIGYFESQRQGQLIHSPKHCLPGSGWRGKRYRKQWVRVEGIDSGGISVNKYAVAKGGKKNLVLYWYQSRGRIITNEYIDRIYLIWDAITKHRTDGALVRLIISFDSSDEGEVLRNGIDFIQSVMPILQYYLPS